MRSKTLRRDDRSKNEPRSDTLWKKILRDVREFYRILFRVRFHPLDHKTSEGAKRWTQTLIRELQIPASRKDTLDKKLFWFLHQTHRTTERRMFKRRDLKNFSPYEIVENYNEAHLRKFLKHQLSSKLFYFVFRNYLSLYCKYIKWEYKTQVIRMITDILRCYETVSKPSDLERIDFWVA